MKQSAKTPLRFAADITYHLGVVARAAREVELHSDGEARERAAYLAEVARRLRSHSRLLEKQVTQ